MGRYDRALADCDDVIRLEPEHRAAHYARATVWQAMRQYDKALADYNEALRIEPQLGLAYLGRGMIWQHKRNYDAAIADFDAGLRLDPKSMPAAYSYCAAAWRLKGHLDKALIDCNELVRFYPKSPWVYCSRGAILQESKQLDQAIADYTKASRLDPNYFVAFYDRATAWFAKSDYDKAIADFNEATRIDPKSFAAYYSRAGVWHAKGNYEKAVADCDRAARIDPKNPLLWNSRGWLAATCPNPKYRDGKKAVEAGMRACELTAWKDARALDTLAAAYAEAGDFANAVKWEEKAIALYPHSRSEPTARLALYKTRKPYRDQANPGGIAAGVPSGSVGVRSTSNARVKTGGQPVSRHWVPRLGVGRSSNVQRIRMPTPSRGAWHPDLDELQSRACYSWSSNTSATAIRAPFASDF